VHAVNHEIPAQRWQAFASVAAASQSDTVLIACRSEAVRRQYEQAVSRLGGRPENLVFELLEPETQTEGKPDDHE
jgi:hypothetical protein